MPVEQGGLDSTGTPPVEWRAQVECVRDRIEHRFRRHVGFAGVERSRELNGVGAELSAERQPFFDREIRIALAFLTRRQLLHGCRQNPDLHELRCKASAHQCLMTERRPTRRRGARLR
jgi:hypothetical protein